MKNLLFPFFVKKIGWVLFLIGTLFGLIILFFDPEPSIFDVKVFGIVSQDFFEPAEWFSFFKNNIFDEITAVLIIVGGALVAFSKQKIEDEYVSKVRLDSLMWATYVNYAVLLVGIFLVYDVPFLWVLIFNMFTILYIFIIRFYWVMGKSNQLA